MRELSAILICLVPLIACNDGDTTPSTPVASASIGSAGGTVLVTSGSLTGTRVVIPPGAISDETGIEIYEDSTSTVSGFSAVGPAARFEPAGTKFSSAATATLIFDPGSVSSATVASDFRVERRGSDGQLSQLTPASVDMTGGSVIVELSEFSVYWVVIPASVSTSNYFPMGDGDRYVYDNGATLTLSLTSTEPNLIGVNLTKASFALALNNPGFYLRRSSGNTTSLGNFSSAVQEINDSAVAFLPSVLRVGESQSSDSDYTGYSPPGSTRIVYTGRRTVTARLVSRGRLDTPLRSFTDVILMEETSQFVNTVGESGTVVDRIWYARNIGPVQILLEGIPLGSLIQATVNGRPVE